MTDILPYILFDYYIFASCIKEMNVPLAQYQYKIIYNSIAKMICQESFLNGYSSFVAASEKMFITKNR